MSIKIAKCSKVSFDSKAQAQSDIKLQRSQQVRFNKRFNNNKKSNAKQHCYECARCGKWHITTLKRKRKY